MNYRALAIIAALIAAGGTISYLLQPPPAQPGEGAPIEQVDIPRLNAIQKSGEALYVASCAACHGVNVAGKQGIAPSFVNIMYRPKFHSDGAFYVAVQNGVRAHHWPFGSMPAVEGVDSEDVSLIIEYVRAIQRENGIE